jgi:hypothetical protein
MASLNLSWDNSTISGNPNAINQRISWRRTSTGGAFLTTGITPANDLNTSVNSAVHTTAAFNRVYQYKVQAICTIGGPVDNLNGLKEGIVFNCISPTFITDLTEATATINTFGTDLTKARFTLKLTSSGATIATATENVSGSTISHQFTGLTAYTSYYVLIELYATVDGADALSSNVAYGSITCGTGKTGYYVTTGGSGLITFQNNTTTSSIDGTTSGSTWFALNEPFPILGLSAENGTHGAYTGSFTVNATISGSSCRVELWKNGALYLCTGQVGTGSQSYVFSSVTFATNDIIIVKLEPGDVCP